DPSRPGGSVSQHRLRYFPTWADVIEESAAEQATALRLVAQLGACEAAALAFCRLLEQWARGDAQPATPGGRQSALRRAAERVETAITGLEDPLDRYLLELEADAPEGRSWYGEPGAAELLDWEPILSRACGTRRAGLSGAGSAAAGARRPRRRRAHRADARPLVAVGRAVRPARQPA